MFVTGFLSVVMQANVKWHIYHAQNLLVVFQVF